MSRPTIHRFPTAIAAQRPHHARTADHPAEPRVEASMGAAVLALVAWGALAFGAVYPWAYAPLLAGAAATAIWGLTRRVPQVRHAVCRPLLVTLLVLLGAIALQLVPIDRDTLVQLSPATDDFLRDYDVRYSLGVRLQQEGKWPLRHSLSVNPGATLVGAAFVAIFGALVLGLARGLNGRDVRRFASGVTALGVILSLIAIVQQATWNGKVYGLWRPMNEGAVAFGPFINRNHFAGWMLLALPFVIGAFAAQIARGMVGVRRDWRSRLAWFSTPDANRAVLTGFAILIMGFALVATMSRSGITFFLLALVVTTFNVIRRQTTRTKRGLLATYLALVFVAAVTWAGYDAIAERFSAADWATGGRAGAWTDARRIHDMFPVFGTGFNTYGTATSALQQFQRGWVHYREVHNDYLQLLVEGGYLVTVPAVALLVVFTWRVWRRFRERGDDTTGYWLRLGAVTGILAIALQEMVEFSLQMPGNAALFMVLCAIAVRRSSIAAGLAEGTRGRHGRGDTPEPKTPAPVSFLG